MSIDEEKLIVWMDQTDKKLARLEANQMAIINGDFCDANTEPKEPLIKDKKIRKAVRAWAEVVRKEETFVVTYNAEYHDCCIYTAGISNTAMIDLGIDLNINEGSYTITELCGEEEE